MARVAPFVPDPQAEELRQGAEGLGARQPAGGGINHTFANEAAGAGFSVIRARYRQR